MAVNWRVLVLAGLAFGNILWGYIPGTGPIRGPIQGHEKSLAKSALLEPSCLQTRELIQWSQNNYGGGRKIDLKNAEFIVRLAQATLEKLDSRQLLFLDAETKAFSASLKRVWLAVLDQGDCTPFEKSITDLFSPSRSRFLAILEKIKVKTSSISSSKDSTSQEDSSKEVGWAISDAKLSRRIENLARQALSESTPQILSAYGGNRQKFVVDSLIQVMEEESAKFASEPRNLLAKAALGAMDHYSTYLSESEFIDFHEDLSAGTTGVGVRLRKVPQGLLIESLVPHAPAEASGNVKPGDTIVSVDDMSVAEMPFAESRRLFRGAPESIVKLGLRRGGNHREVSLHRAPFSFEDGKIKLSRIKGHESVLVASIPSFYSGGFSGDLNEVESSSFTDMRNQLIRELAKKTRPKALVLDVRGNPGGYMEEAVQMAGLFVGELPVVSVVEKDGKKTLRDIGAVKIFSGPVVILQNDESASAAEILAGALRDYEKAIIVGTETSYGKGSVQRLFDLETEVISLPGVVKLTTSLFYTPLGHSPTNGGIRSDILFKKTLKKSSSNRVPESQSVVDEAVISLLKSARIRMDSVRNSVKELSFSRQSNSKSLDSEAELDEAVRVASDWLAFETNENIKNTTKNNRRDESKTPHYKTRRDVVGY